MVAVLGLRLDHAWLFGLCVSVLGGGASAGD